MVEEKILATGNQSESANNPSQADKDVHSGGKLLASIVKESDSDAETKPTRLQQEICMLRTWSFAA